METPQIRPAFVFINDTNPEDAKSKTKRKIVRSHAARGPHSTTSAPGDSPTQSDRLRSAAAWSKHQVRRRKREKASSTTIALSAASLDDLTPQTGTQDGLDPKQNPQAIDEESGHLNREGNESTSSQSGKSFFDQHDTTSSNSPTLESIPTMPGAGWVAPFVNDPGSRKPYIPLLIEHYLANLATDIPELDAGTPFILRHKWFPMVITSTATFYVVMLTAASHYAATHSPLLERPHIRAILLHLKQQTLCAISVLLRSSPNQPTSDAVVAAVAKMASYEAMFGDAELFHMHMRGLRDMVRARGGLETLGLDGLLMRMVLWIDLNGAFLLNGRPYFRTSRPLAGHVALEPNPQGFLGAS